MRDVIAIETRRLKLRALRMSDATRIARFCGDPQVGRNLAMTPLPYLETAAEGWLMTLAARKPLGRDFVYAANKSMRTRSAIGSAAPTGAGASPPKRCRR
jgi:RimJ/RimL family protein N-acetyltransferase